MKLQASYSLFLMTQSATNFCEELIRMWKKIEIKYPKNIRQLSEESEIEI